MTVRTRLTEPAPTPELRPLEVLEVIDLSPSYRRVRFFAYHLLGAELAPAATVKLVFGAGAARPFTLAGFDSRSGELSVDFLLHGNGGSANDWVRQAAPGQSLSMFGPNGERAALPLGARRLVLAGDGAALPTLAAMVAALEPQQAADILVEVPTLADVRNLESPAALNVEWLVPSAPDPRPLPRAVRRLPVDKVDHWFIACEATSARLVTEHLEQERGVPEHARRVLAYWQADTPATNQGEFGA